MSRKAEVFEIDDIGVLETLNNPTRLKIMSHLEEPNTVRGVAEALGVPVTRLYYHVNLLEEVGVIDVVETRKAGAMIERVYQAVAGMFRPGPGLFESTGDVDRLAKVAAGTILDGARIDAEAGLRHHFEALAAGKERSESYPGTISRSILKTTRKGAAEFARKLEEFIADWRDQVDEEVDGDGAEEYALSLVFFPLVSPTHGSAK